MSVVSIGLLLFVVRTPEKRHANTLLGILVLKILSMFADIVGLAVSFLRSFCHSVRVIGVSGSII